MRIITYYIFLNLLFPVITFCQTPDFKEIILNKDFIIYKKYDDVPKSIRIYLDSLNGEKIKIADVGKRFEATDNISNINLPRRRVLFIANYAHYWILAYEHGGRGYHTHYLYIDNSESIDISEIVGIGFHLRRIDKFNDFKEKIKTKEVKLTSIERL